jgi:uncharacterized damage-inducible protein DinB
MIAVDENLCNIRLPALRRDIVCDVSTVRLVLAALGADLYAGSQYGVSTNNLSQLSVKKRNVDMSDATDQRLLEALLDSWDRNNTILVNLLRALPKGGLGTKPMEGSPSVAELFTHIHFVRLVLVSEDAPEFARKLPEEEWVFERDPDRIAQMLNDSAEAVRDAVKSRVEAGRDMNLHYDHPILLLQHMIWHEGYHHGQIKLALKVADRPITDEEAGPVTWDIWMRKK